MLSKTKHLKKSGFLGDWTALQDKSFGESKKLTAITMRTEKGRWKTVFVFLPLNWHNQPFITEAQLKALCEQTGTTNMWF